MKRSWIVAHGHNLPPSTTVQGWCKNKDELEKSSIENNGGDSKTIFTDKTPQLTVGLKAFCEQPVDCMGCSTHAGPFTDIRHTYEIYVLHRHIRQF